MHPLKQRQVVGGSREPPDFWELLFGEEWLEASGAQCGQVNKAINKCTTCPAALGEAPGAAESRGPENKGENKLAYYPGRNTDGRE